MKKIELAYKNTSDSFDECFLDGAFSISKWRNYVNSILPGLSTLLEDDAKEYDFNNDILPVIQKSYETVQRRRKLSCLLDTLVMKANESLKHQFGKSVQCEIVLYLGLCNGAGWALDIKGKKYVLLGIEKIIELDWDNEKDLIGLLYHELGHAYQGQYGILDRKADSLHDAFMWQLYQEGIAMYFEQLMVGDFDFYHQDENGWKDFYDARLAQLKIDFARDCMNMTQKNQRYFGDWVSYYGYSDAGYYLGTRFVQYLCLKRNFNSILSLTIDEVIECYQRFCEA